MAEQNRYIQGSPTFLFIPINKFYLLVRVTGDGVAAEVMELSGGYDGGKYKYDINVDNDTVMNMYPIQLVQSPCWN